MKNGTQILISAEAKTFIARKHLSQGTSFDVVIIQSEHLDQPTIIHDSRISIDPGIRREILEDYDEYVDDHTPRKD